MKTREHSVQAVVWLRRLVIVAILLLPQALATRFVSNTVDPLKLYATTAADWDATELYYVSENPWAEHDFNVWRFMQNSAIVCSVDAPDLALELFHELRDHVDGGYVIHDFSYTFDGVVVEPPWVSGFANGVALSAISALYECYGDPRYKQLADELFTGYVMGGFATRVDGGLWFQEYPVPGSRVLNGHIYGVYGLYYYFHATHNWAAVPFFSSGVEAVAVNGWAYRRPGQINLYDLYGQDTDDYGPSRTIRQQDILCLMTGDTRFRQLRDAFLEDMPDFAIEVSC